MTIDPSVRRNRTIVALDNQPGVDLNASLHGAVLPLTGTYVLRAATSRGFGDYRLHFAVTSMAAATEGARIIPFMDAFTTVPVNGTTTPTAIVLDPRGYQLSGAQMTIATTPQPGDRGQIEFVPAALTSNPDGSVQTTATARATGKVTFAPAFVDTFTSSVMSMTAVAVSAQSPRRIPRYQSVARQPFAVTGLYEGGWVGLSTGAYERVPIERHAPRLEVRGSGREAPSTGFSAGKSKQVSGAAGTATRAPDRGSLATDHDLEPLDASTAVPLREVEPHGMTATALAITSCGQNIFAQGIVPAGTELHPPFAATLTDLTPPTGGTDPNGPVGTDGIHGHRIEKNARLKLEITDALGQAPTYPVLVQLALGGPQHGQVILDPDGNRVTCNVAAFIWHDRDDQGNLIAANEEFEIGMGTLSSYVGVAPDPVTPGQIVPVWGTAELLNLSAQAKVQIDGAWADPLLMGYGVHPEPGKPDHFLCTDRQGQACPDVFEYWTGYQLDVTSQPPSSLPRVLLNAYFLADRYGNLVYGPTATSATSPGAGVTVGFADQTSGTTSGNPAGYALTTTWPMSPAPSGQLTSTLSATYPDDPAGDWSGGTVSKAITYQFDTGSTHLLLQAQWYEKRLADRGLAVVDGPLPISVAPGATGGLATLADGTTPRLVLLALSGSDVTSLVTGWGEEPSSVPGWGWNTGGGCPEPWCWVQWNPPWDLVVETQATASLRLTLEDGTGRVASEGSFVVHTCPRAEHETDGPPPAQGCTDLAIPSTNGTADVTLNQPGSARGYLGIELTQAPVAPGTYVVWVESLDQAYRVRPSAQLVWRGPAGEYQGGYAICTVMGGEILDENFQRVTAFNVTQPTRAYVRYLDPSVATSTVALDVHSFDDQGTEVDQALAVTLTRVGESEVFLSQPFELLPPWVEAGAAPYLHVDRSPEGDVEVTRAGQNVSGARMARALSARPKKPKPFCPASLAWAITGSAQPYHVPLGLTLPLQAYWGFGLVQESGHKRLYICSPAATDPPDCPAGTGDVVPADQVDSFVALDSVTDQRVDQPDYLLARLEKEPGPSPAAGWWMRAIRTTLKANGTPSLQYENGPPRVTNGVIALKVTVGTDVAYAPLMITWPSSLGCCGQANCDVPCKTVYEPWPTWDPTTVVELPPLVISEADDKGIPPQYLMAQAVQEAGPHPTQAGFLNAYAFRYEPESLDFKVATGDHGTVVDGQRYLFHTGKALFNLGIDNEAMVSYLPCEKTGDGTDTTANGDPYHDGLQTEPCLDVTPPEAPPDFVVTALEPYPGDETGSVWRIPNLDPAAVLQVGVKITQGSDPWASEGFTQAFDHEPIPGSCAEYKVDAETDAGAIPAKNLGRITFGGPLQVTANALYRVRPVVARQVPGGIGFGRSFGEAPSAIELNNLVRHLNPYKSSLPDTKMVPPANLQTTIREWRRQWALADPTDTTPLADSNLMRRYFTWLTKTKIWGMMLNDPSFDVQGQWFASASYGLLQQIPESLRTKLYSVGFLPADRLCIRQQVFDPLGEFADVRNPQLLFNPKTCVKLGAMEDQKASVSEEVGAPLTGEAGCPPRETQCTWERVWKRRFRVYNAGAETKDDGGYGDKIVFRSQQYLPQP